MVPFFHVPVRSARERKRPGPGTIFNIAKPVYLCERDLKFGRSPRSKQNLDGRPARARAQREPSSER